MVIAPRMRCQGARISFLGRRTDREQWPVMRQVWSWHPDQTAGSRAMRMAPARPRSDEWPGTPFCLLLG